MTDHCSAKHTKYQPEGVLWRCPKCGTSPAVRSGHDFYIEDSAEGADEDCGALHVGDTVLCTKCDHAWSGASIAKMLAKLDNQMPCPHCKGTGHVPADVNKAETAKA